WGEVYWARDGPWRSGREADARKSARGNFSSCDVSKDGRFLIPSKRQRSRAIRPGRAAGYTMGGKRMALGYMEGIIDSLGLRKWDYCAGEALTSRPIRADPTFAPSVSTM